MICEGCGYITIGGEELMDFCEICGANLCNSCMAQGHCGQIPASSGMKISEAIDQYCDHLKESLPDLDIDE